MNSRYNRIAWALVCAFGFAGEAAANPLSPDQFSVSTLEALKSFAHDALLLAFRPNVPVTQRAKILNQYGLEPDPNCRNPHFVRALLNPIDLARGVTVTDKINLMQRNPAFRYVEPDFALFPDQVATDPNFGSQWGLHNTGQSGGTVDADMDGPEGWPAISDSATPVVIAVLDNGTDINHQDLAANVWTNPGEIAGDSIDNDGNGFVDDDKGWDFSNNDRDVLPTASNTHGTHCSGIVAMVRNNGVGGAGTAKRVRLMPLQIAGGSVSFYSALANAVDYASLNGAKVISVSYTIDSYSTTFSDAVGRAAARDVVYVNSAGNNSENVDNLRGRLRDTWNNVIFVASTTRNDQFSSFTNFGWKVDIAAPGTDIYATYPSNTYATISGTSMAAPNAAAVIGQIRQLFPALTARQAIDKAMYSAQRLPAFGEAINGGRAHMPDAFEADSTAPSTPASFQVARRSNSAIEVQFQASGDDGTTGGATSYDFRSSTSPINAGNFASAEKMFAQIGGQAFGTSITDQITGLVPGRSYYIAVRAIDNAGNVSSPATVGPISMPAATWIDDVEGVTNWSGWTQTTSKSYSGTKSWTDSPSGNYGASANTTMTQVGTVVLPANPILRFKAVLDLEFYFDELLTEISLDNGATWTQVGRFTGWVPNWQTYNCSLLPWAGQTAKFRFRITSDTSNNFDGAYIDDIFIVSGATSFFDNVEGANTFAPTGGAWATTTTQFFSSTRSWTDSPSGNSTANSDTWLGNNSTLPNPNLGDPELGFMMRSAYRTTDRFTAGVSMNNGASYAMTDRWVKSNTNWSSYSARLPDSTALRVGFHLDTTTGTTQDGVYLDNISVYGEPFINTIGGSVTRRYYNGNPALRPITMEIIGGGPSFLLTLASAPTSPFSLNTTYSSSPVTLKFSGPGFITRKLTNVALSWNTVVNVTLPNGDADASGEVDAADIDFIIAKFGFVVGNPNYSVTADCDGSSEIDAADIDIAVAEFGQVND
ncbi:MAG: S8 family serine peptidase [Chthonomonas sp.]|nr:S8 family serine peptidase [Chthonomonas sp.]